MEPEVRERFERIEAILHATAERSDRMELRFNQRMDRAEKRIDRSEKRMEKFDRRMEAAEKRAEAADKRMEKFDRQLQATRKLVEAGMKLVIRNEVAIRDLTKTQKAFLDSLRRGNGNGHHRA